MFAAIRTAQQESRGFRVLLWIIIHAFVWPLRLVERLEYALTYQAVRVTNPTFGSIRIRNTINARIRIRWGGDRVLHLVMLLATVASVASFIHFYQEEMILAYGDAIARLVMARLATDSINPGIQQLIGVWPPSPQIVMVPLARIGPLYETGLAGSIVAMASFVLGASYMYKLVLSYTKNRKAAFVSFFAFASADMLFLQSTPMSEVPFIAFFVMSIYYVKVWIDQDDLSRIKPLCAAAVALGGASMTRYEGWILFVPLTFVIVYSFWRRRFPYPRAEDRFLVFATITMAPIGAWLALNYQYLGDPLFFMNSEFSSGAIARATQAGIDESDRSIHNLPLSFELYARSALDTSGWITSAMGMLGITLLVASRGRGNEKLLALCLLYPFVFFVASLYFGWSALWHPDVIENANWGTRYGLLMIPAAALGVGFLVHKIPKFAMPCLVFVILSTIITWQGGIVSTGEARFNKTNNDAVIHAEITTFLGANYDRGIVLINRFGNEYVFFNSSVPLNKIAYEGVEQGFWNQSLTRPVDSHIDWIVMRGYEDGRRQDEIWQNLRGSAVLRENYDLVFQIEGAEIYKIKGTDLPSIGPVPSDPSSKEEE